MSEEYLLQMEGICKSFAGVHALDHVNFAVRPGKVMCLAGENGCGKSTLVKIISGVYTRDEGIVTFEGKTIQRITPAEATRLGIQVIYQDLSIFPNLTVMENLAVNSEVTAGRRMVNRKRWEQTAREALSKIGYDIDLYAKMGDLSMADKQLVAICRALLFNAKLIIMDEPTTALTKKEVDALFKTVRQLRDSGIAIMFISHKTEEIFEISDDVCIMRNGKNVFSGRTAELTRRDFTFYMTGRELSDERFVPKNLSKEPVLEVQNLSMKGRLRDVSLQLRKGEILGVTGLLGSGRTELALALFGLARPSAGKILLHGKEVRISSPIAAQKLRIGYVPEDRLTEGLCLQQPIADNITLSSLKRLSNALGILKKKDVYADADIWVKQFSIATDDARKFASTLSGGNQQKIVLSKWLSNELDVLILNGPTVGVDVGAKQDIHQLVHQLAGEGLAVIIISDDLSEVVLNCSRVVVMKDGAIVGEMEGEHVTEENILEIIR
ncbi:MAG: sugar ABC transporter ATP-binding protein [Oscillospiraceae bacterium]|nr:sugar ABC transporter ATP-binding protein [Oscillospiraceae bacterium]